MLLLTLCSALVEKRVRSAPPARPPHCSPASILRHSADGDAANLRSCCGCTTSGLPLTITAINLDELTRPARAQFGDGNSCKLAVQLCQQSAPACQPAISPKGRLRCADASGSTACVRRQRVPRLTRPLHSEMPLGCRNRRGPLQLAVRREPVHIHGQA